MIYIYMRSMMHRATCAKHKPVFRQRVTTSRKPVILPERVRTKTDKMLLL